MSVAQQKGAGAHYVWNVPGRSVSIHLNLDVVERLSQHRQRGDSGRVVEIGGILLGFIRRSPDGYLVAVEDFDPVESEHARGESWSLSRRDCDHLAGKLQRLSRRRSDEPNIVGWFRAHSRPGLFLDQKDFELFREYFAHPAAIALIFKPEVVPPVAGFFIWEDGEIERHRSYKTFPFEVRQLRSAAVPTALEPVRALTRVAEMPRPVPRRPSRLPAGVRSRGMLLLLPIAVGLAFGIFWDPKPIRNKLPEPVARLAKPEPQARAVFEAPGAAESTPQPRADASDATTAPYTPPPEETPAPVPTRRARTVETRAVRKLELPTVRRKAPEPELDFKAPVITASAKYEAVPSSKQSFVRAVATVEPVHVSGFRRAVGSIPGLGFLKHKKHTEEGDYVPAKPLTEVRPISPVSPSEEIPVRIKVTVSSSGDVDRAELLSRRVEPAVAGVALDAAKRWRFEPARVDEKPVASELILNFRFGAAVRGGS